MKRPILEAATLCPDARVNSLEGIPQAIVDASVESWQVILLKNAELADENEEDIIVQSNESVSLIP